MARLGFDGRRRGGAGRFGVIFVPPPKAGRDGNDGQKRQPENNAAIVAASARQLIFWL